MNLRAVGAAAPRRDLAAGSSKENPLISKAAGYGEDTAHFFVKDRDHPYVQETPFDWIRGYQVGGKSLIWGRACQRWSKHEFVAPEKLGYGMNWPIGYDDVAPWYSHVEQFIGVCGNRDGLEAMPDGEYPPAVRLQLRREASARRAPREVRQPPRRAGTLGAPVAAEGDPSPAGARHLPGAQPLHARLSVRRLLQLELVDAAVGGEDGEAHDPPGLGRALHRLRREDRTARPACA